MTLDVSLPANHLFLIDIMRILLTKVKRSGLYSEATPFRFCWNAIKATMMLFPLFGVNNLLFLCNPGGASNKYYVICSTLFRSTQDIFVSILYYFVSRDVRDEIVRQYRRIKARGSGNATH